MENRVVVVDDDPIILKRAWNILTEAGMKAIVLKSGSKLLDYLKEDPEPDLILLDIRMPDMDGFDVLTSIRAGETSGNHIPVIFLTATEDEETEAKGLNLGAMDYIKKPFLASVLVARVKNAIELVHLQNHLSEEVKRKTAELEQLLLHVVKSLASAIDAKDAYTNGHSRRVAEYSAEIAKRAGFDEQYQEEIYMMGMLHDVGKIGVPDTVINKNGRLDDEEFALIKKHPAMGGSILENITEMPRLSAGARWHHERYGGGGYPDSLSGEDIPEEARIIAVADAYDAMTSNRSYRDALPQATVRAEIEKGKEKQFDPRYADIMLEMIDEDKDYNMRDKKETT